MTPRRRLTCATLLTGLALLLLEGCQQQTQVELRQQVERLQKKVEQQDHQLAADRLTIQKLHEQLRTARGFTTDDLEVIYSPVKIEIASLSGGEDYDGRPGDDGVTVYIQPIDRHHDAVKVAGDIRVELYDLANPPGENRIGLYEIPVGQAADHWYGKLATYHFTVRCPWQNGPPKHDEITIRATFVDYLTQRAMTAQTVCTVRLGD